MGKYSKIPYVFQGGETGLHLRPERPDFSFPYSVFTLADYDSVMAELDQVLAISYDTETTSLYFDELIIVGFSFSYLIGNDTKTWVVVINHEAVEYCVTDYEKVRALVAKIISRKFVFLFNSRFDLRVNERTFGMPVYEQHTIDVQSLIFLADTNNKLPALKDSALKFLGIRAPDYGQMSEGKDLQHTDIVKYVQYSAYDAYNTLKLAEMFYPEISARYRLPHLLDCKMIPAISYFEDSIFDISREEITKIQVDVRKRLEELQGKIYDSVGVFLLSSAPQLSKKLTELGYDTGVKTKTGNMSVGIDALSNLGDVEFVKWIVEYKKMSKLDNSYLQQFLRREDLGLPFRFHYILNNAPTMRLAAGSYSKSKKKSERQKHYFMDINFQSISKPKAIERRVDWDPVTYEINFHDKGQYLVESGDPKMNLRKAFVTPGPEWLYSAIDYAGQELRIAANLSGEPVWIETFLNGGDVHEQTAKKIWGEAAYDKNKRKKAKIANFGCPTRDTYLNTQRGLVHPQSLRPYDRIYNRYGELQTWKQLEVEGQDILTFDFSNGLVESYHVNHRFLCMTPDKKQEWVFAKDLTPEHEILSVGSKDLYSAQPSQLKFSTYRGLKKLSDFTVMSDDLYFSYFIGVVLGDGSIGYSRTGIPNCVSFVASLEDESYHVGNLARLGFKVTRDRFSGSWVVLRVSNTSLAAWFSSVFPDKVFSEDAWSMFPTEALGEILAGLIDSDGKRGNGCVILTNSNRKLLSDVSRVVSLLGGYSSIRQSKAGVTLDGGARSYLNAAGYNYLTAYELSVYSIHGLPCRRLHKIAGVGEDRCYTSGFRNIPATFFEKVFAAEKLKAGGYKGARVQGADNLRSGRQAALTRRWVKAFSEYLLPEYGIGPDCMPVRVRSVTASKGSIFTLETSSHEYLSSFLVSHNTLYGGGTFFLMQKLHMTEKEALDFLERYREALPQLFAWTERIHNEARARGYIITPYGVPRRLSYYYRQGGGIAKFADRSAVNTMVQGSAGMIIRLALTRLFKRIAYKIDDDFVSDFYNQVLFRGTVHDELDNVVLKERFRAFLEVVVPAMRDTVPKSWPVPMEVEVSVGNNWGELFAIDYHDPNLTPIQIEKKSEKVAVPDDGIEDLHTDAEIADIEDWDGEGSYAEETEEAY